MFNHAPFKLILYCESITYMRMLYFLENKATRSNDKVMNRYNYHYHFIMD